MDLKIYSLATVTRQLTKSLDFRQNYLSLWLPSQGTTRARPRCAWCAGRWCAPSPTAARLSWTGRRWAPAPHTPTPAGPGSASSSGTSAGTTLLSGSAFSLLSWIHIGNADPDPGAWKLITNYKYTRFCSYQKGLCTVPWKVLKFFTYFLLKYIFLIKIQIFGSVTLKVWAGSGPDTHGSAFVCLPGSGSALRHKAGSGSALKPMRIRFLCPLAQPPPPHFSDLLPHVYVAIRKWGCLPYLLLLYLC